MLLFINFYGLLWQRDQILLQYFPQLKFSEEGQARDELVKWQRHPNNNYDNINTWTTGTWMVHRVMHLGYLGPGFAGLIYMIAEFWESYQSVILPATRISADFALATLHGLQYFCKLLDLQDVIRQGAYFLVMLSCIFLMLFCHMKFFDSPDTQSRSQARRRERNTGTMTRSDLRAMVQDRSAECQMTRDSRLHIEFVHPDARQRNQTEN